MQRRTFLQGTAAAALSLAQAAAQEKPATRSANERISVCVMGVGGRGGGLHNASNVTSLTNVTVSGNTAATQGGGIWHNSAGTVALYHSTVAGNSAASGGKAIWGDPRRRMFAASRPRPRCQLRQVFTVVVRRYAAGSSRRPKCR